MANTKLKVLNLSRTGLTEAGSVAEMLSYNKALMSLMLHWNKIRWKGAVEIFKALTDNDSLRILDISYNSLH